LLNIVNHNLDGLNDDHYIWTVLALTEEFSRLREKMKICKDVMTPNPLCCLPTDNVIEIAQTMKRENIGSMPVIDNTESQKLIGIITDRDLAMKIVGQGRDARATQVEAVMTRKVLTCRADDEINIAMKLMSDYQIRRIVIVDNANIVEGIISQADLATRMNQPVKTAEVVKEISQANND
jgi:CBS domain-containing protein